MADLDQATAIRIYEIMTTIKQCDERFRALLSSGQISIMGYYSPRGQEAISAATAPNLRPDDYMVTTYRGLHDHIAKGVPLRQLWAECIGKATGTCKGKGGPMHVTHPASGMMLTTGIVGAGLPVANGLGWASQLRGDDRVTVCNFGDGAANIGAFHEALNLASLWTLPVVFLCHNNRYAEHTAFAHGTSVERIADRAVAYAMPGFSIDGNDAIAVWETTRIAVDRARSGEGPTLIEANTFRFHGHSFGDPAEYIPKEEMVRALEHDPFPRYRKWLLDAGHGSEEDLTEVDKNIQIEIDDAVDFALTSPYPDLEELHTDLFAEVSA